MRRKCRHGPNIYIDIINLGYGFVSFFQAELAEAEAQVRLLQRDATAQKLAAEEIARQERLDASNSADVGLLYEMSTDEEPAGKY